MEVSLHSVAMMHEGGVEHEKAGSAAEQFR